MTRSRSTVVVGATWLDGDGFGRQAGNVVETAGGADVGTSCAYWLGPAPSDSGCIMSCSAKKRGVDAFLQKVAVLIAVVNTIVVAKRLS